MPSRVRTMTRPVKLVQAAVHASTAPQAMILETVFRQNELDTFKRHTWMQDTWQWVISVSAYLPETPKPDWKGVWATRVMPLTSELTLRYILKGNTLIHAESEAHRYLPQVVNHAYSCPLRWASSIMPIIDAKLIVLMWSWVEKLLGIETHRTYPLSNVCATAHHRSQ